MTPELALPSSAPARSAVAARSRVVTLAALVAMLLAALLLSAPAALAEAPRSITVEDTTGDLNAGPLTERLQGLDFREGVDLVALTVDVRAQGFDPRDDLALNDAVLAYARAEHPEWLSSGGAYWRDGLVIIAIDPDNRFMGTYAGEDVTLSDSQFVSIQDDMRPVAREGDWNGAIVAGAETYASLLGRPLWMSPAAILTALAGLGAAALAALASLWRGAQVRSTVRAALPRYDDVMLKYTETELAARTIPQDSEYGEPVLRDYAEFQRQAAEATALHGQIPSRIGILWGIRPAHAYVARRFRTATEQIDVMDDQIIATNDLLSRSNRWRDAWEREVAPVRESLASVEGAVSQAPRLADAPTAQALRTVAVKVEEGLKTTTARLEDGSMTPDDALQELDLMTSALGRAATAHRDAVIASTARTEEEARIMRGAGGDGGYDRFGTIRGRRHHYYPGAYDGSWSLSPILWLALWQRSADSQIETHRNPPQMSSSSSGGFSGYSGGGGGFSGAGSSGRF